MEETKKVTLHGMWASPYLIWMKLALKVKGIPYEYVEENMKNKSQILIQYNPIYKKVPVLVHNGNAIVESLVILQYIDETWKHPPHLLPTDPFSRSMVRFWADFILNKILLPLREVVASHEIEEEKSMLEVQMNMKTLEENMKVIFPHESPTCVEDVGMLEIMLFSLYCVVKATEEAFELTLMEPKKHPLLYSRMASVSALEVVKGTAPPHEKFVRFYRAYRRSCIQLSKASSCVATR